LVTNVLGESNHLNLLPRESPVKRFCLLPLLVSVISVSAFSTSYTFEESGGSLNLAHSLKFGDALQLTGSKIVSMVGPNLHLTASPGGKLGSLKLTGANLVSSAVTGSKSGGSITDTYAYGPGTMSMVNSSRGPSIPNGALFTGIFSSETLTVTYDYSKELNAKGKTIYVSEGRTWQLVGDVVGKMYTGQKLSGTFNISRLGHNPAIGTTDLSAAPEPGTLLLLATGLLGIAGLVRSRFRSTNRNTRF
jgi:PEP-CTERM motif